MGNHITDLDGIIFAKLSYPSNLADMLIYFTVHPVICFSEAKAYIQELPSQMGWSEVLPIYTVTYTYRFHHP